MEKSDMNETSISKTKKSKGIWLSVILVILFCALPTYYIFTQNAIEVTFIESLLPIAASVLIGLFVFFLIFLITKRVYFSALLSSVMMFCFLNFSLLILAASFIPVIKSHAGWGGLFLAAVIFVIAFFLLRKVNKKEGMLDKITLVLVIVISGMILFNTVLAAPSIIKRVNAQKETTEFVENTVVSADSEQPNIYYFILDEYGSFHCLEKYYGYPNSEFHHFLSDKGFAISDTSFNRSTKTKFCLAENLCLDYVCTSDMIDEDFSNLINDAEWYYVMDELGYSQYSFSTDISKFPIAELDNAQETATVLEKLFTGKTEGGENIFYLAYQNSVLYTVFGFFSLDISLPGTIPTDRTDRVQWVLDYFEDFDAGDVRPGTMIISYICSPHVPFAFDENGNRQPEDEAYNWSDPQYYLGQLAYVTNRMQTTIDNIIQYDPNSIIILQSDHGFRKHGHDIDKKVNMPFEMESKDMMRILNAVYFMGEEINIEGLSGPNTLRAVLTKMGLDYPLLEDPK